MEATERPRIMIIDDDEILLVTTRAVLEAEGFEVSTRLGGFGASWLVLQTRPDIVLLDVDMPGLSGPGLAAVLQSEPSTRGVPIYFHSGSDEATLQAKVAETGVAGYVRKGDRAQLRAAIAKALERRRERR
jgi:CheY-like chemotaxis protein